MARAALLTRPTASSLDAGGHASVDIAARTSTPSLFAAPLPSRAERQAILRFRESERMMHWAIAIPFMACFVSAVLLVLIYNPDPTRPGRNLVSWSHRASGLCLIAFPAIALLRNLRDVGTHVENVKQAWSWAWEDLRWLALSALGAVNRRVSLPEEGKFNAGEKLNFMMVMITVPLFIVSGVLVWMPGVAFVSWILHVSLAALCTPLMLGHIFMATLNPGTRPGLQGMISGLVDRRWAKHHYRRWYREHFESQDSGRAPAVTAADDDAGWADRFIAETASAGEIESERSSSATQSGATHIRCRWCLSERPVASPTQLMSAVFETEPLRCSSCGEEMDCLEVITEPEQLGSILDRLDAGASRLAQGDWDRRHAPGSPAVPVAQPSAFRERSPATAAGPSATPQRAPVTAAAPGAVRATTVAATATVVRRGQPRLARRALPFDPLLNWTPRRR